MIQLTAAYTSLQIDGINFEAPEVVTFRSFVQISQVPKKSSRRLQSVLENGLLGIYPRVCGGTRSVMGE
jgi:hypothetical protein